MNAHDIEEEAHELRRRVYLIGQQLVEIGWAAGAYADKEGSEIQLTVAGRAALAKIVEVTAPLSPALRDSMDWGALWFIMQCAPGLNKPRSG